MKRNSSLRDFRVEPPLEKKNDLEQKNNSQIQKQI